MWGEVRMFGDDVYAIPYLTVSRQLPYALQENVTWKILIPGPRNTKIELSEMMHHDSYAFHTIQLSTEFLNKYSVLGDIPKTTAKGGSTPV